MGSNREKSNIAIAILDKWRILTNPISHFKGGNKSHTSEREWVREEGGSEGVEGVWRIWSTWEIGKLILNFF